MQLKRLRNIVNEYRDLFFNENKYNLIYNLTNIFQELNNLVSAKHSLCTKIAR